MTPDSEPKAAASSGAARSTGHFCVTGGMDLSLADAPPFLGFLTLGGNEPTWAWALSTQRAARSASSRQVPGKLRKPPIGRSAGPNGPDPSMAASSPASASPSRTPTADPNSPANMLPCTKAPRLPNIGLISTSGSSGSSDRKNRLSSSLGLGISTVGS